MGVVNLSDGCRGAKRGLRCSAVGQIDGCGEAK
jgi:hypothetical protein